MNPKLYSNSWKGDDLSFFRVPAEHIPSILFRQNNIVGPTFSEECGVLLYPVIVGPDKLQVFLSECIELFPITPSAGARTNFSDKVVP